MGSISINFDPTWPWSLPGVGVVALIGVIALLAAITVWTYWGVRQTTWRHVLAVLVLRLLALGVALLVILRPSLAFHDRDEAMPSRLFILLDASESMTITDEFNNLSRWAEALRILDNHTVKNALKKLTDAKVEVVYYQAAESLSAFDPNGQPNGKRTDIGTWVFEFKQRHAREKNLRGLILLSDGADNGSKYPTLEQATQLRLGGVCPIYAFGLGRPTTTATHNDIELADIRVEPDPIPVKGQVKVAVVVNAPGFEETKVQLSLWIEEAGSGKPKLATTKNEVLSKPQRNEIVLTADAPETAGEIKVTVKVQPLQGEVSAHNNEISTYATVTKEGVSILWVEGHRRLESTFAIAYGLKKDPRFRPFFIERLSDDGGGDPYQFDRRHYDVIVIGDISAKRFAAGKPQVFSKISEMITEKGTGLLWMGGYQNPWSANNDWNTADARPLLSLLPVSPASNGQVTAKTLLDPTNDGLKYLLRLDENPDKNKHIWRKAFDPLDGYTNLANVSPTSTVLAKGEINDAPLLVETQRKGRILVFAGDTTYLDWRRNSEAVAAYARFWKQLMLYLARQENMDGSVQIVLDKRRIPADGSQRLPFTLKVRGKNGQDVKNPQFKVVVTGPDKNETEVPVLLEGGEYRGYFLKANQPGEYVLEASVKGKDTDGNELPTKPSVARFLGYAQDLEMLRTAADPEFLAKIATASGGQFALADERKLASLLEDLLVQQNHPGIAKAEIWPDWRRNPASPGAGDQIAALWNSTALPCFLVFVALLCTEWYLRRRWGLV
jgi:hypothetical protein